MQTRPGNQEQIANHQPFYKKIIFHTVQSKIDISEAHYPHLVFFYFENPNVDLRLNILFIKTIHCMVVISIE